MVVAAQVDDLVDHIHVRLMGTALWATRAVLQAFLTELVLAALPGVEGLALREERRCDAVCRGHRGGVGNVGQRRAFSDRFWPRRHLRSRRRVRITEHLVCDHWGATVPRRFGLLEG